MAKKNELENFTKQLIISLTNFAEGEENFDQCLEYVSSNFKYHRFLSPDSHKINRIIDGLCEKFKVHVQEKKAASLKNLVSKFLDIPAFEDRDHGRTETHWAVLSLLLNLSDSPVNVIYKETKKKKRTESIDDFDWTAYLLEGEDIYIEPDFGSADDEDDEDLGDKPHVKFKPQNEENYGAFLPHSTVDDSFITAINDTDGAKAQRWLDENLIVQYWKEARVPVHSDHRSCRLNQHWENHQSECNLFHVKDYQVITEYQLVRETIWMFSGVSECYVYTIEDGSCTVKDTVRVSHLTKESLSTVLEPVCKYVDILTRLQGFVDWVNSGEVAEKCIWKKECVVGHTYIAFAACILNHLKEFKGLVTTFEKQTIKQVEPVTISSLLNYLNPWFPKLDLLGHILANGVEVCSHVTSTTGRASHLLAVIYDTLTGCDTMFNECSISEVHLLMSLWIKTCKPYLDIIDKWICQGLLEDIRKEFIIQRNESVKCLDETFWNAAFSLHIPPEKEQEEFDQQDAIQYAPSFLLPLLHPIIMAGKSMEILESLGKKSEYMEKGELVGIFHRRKTLYRQLISSIEESLGTEPSADVTAVDDSHISSHSGGHEIVEIRSVFEKNIGEQMEVKGVKDPLLKLNFSQIVQTQGEFKAESLMEKEDNEQKQLNSLDLSGLTPIQLVLERSLYPCITQRYHTVSSGLLDVMKTQFHLMDYFAAMRRFYLMEAGDTMYNFYVEIFERLRYKESWKDVSYLSMLLHDALEAHYPNEIDRLTVEIAAQEKPSKDKSPITALEGLRLRYQVTWPVNVVFSGARMDIYDQVFSFLLQIKRAKYCLDELRFSELEKDDILNEKNNKKDDGKKDQQLEESYLDTMTSPSSSSSQVSRSQLIHQMHMIRMKLLTFVNSLHTYIMTRILHSTGLEFQADIKKAKDLDEVIRTHQKYLDRILERCLQHKDTRLIKDVVTKVLSLAIQFQCMWDEGVHSLSVKMIEDMDLEFSRCVTFLLSVLNQAIKRGSFQHLEYLELALITFADHKKKS